MCDVCPLERRKAVHPSNAVPVGARCSNVDAHAWSSGGNTTFTGTGGGEALVRFFLLLDSTVGAALTTRCCCLGVAAANKLWNEADDKEEEEEDEEEDEDEEDEEKEEWAWSKTNLLYAALIFSVLLTPGTDRPLHHSNVELLLHPISAETT